MKPMWNNVYTEQLQGLCKGLLKRRAKGLDTTIIELQITELQAIMKRSEVGL